MASSQPPPSLTPDPPPAPAVDDRPPLVTPMTPSPGPGAAVASSRPPAEPLLSIVCPARDEAANLSELVRQVERLPLPVELIVVDDGSRDQSLTVLGPMREALPWLTVLHHPNPKGQSRALWAGVAEARGPYLATLDADLQNDPAELPAMLNRLRGGGLDLVQGDRTASRVEGPGRRAAAWVGRAARRVVLGDTVRDSGCSSRVMRTVLAQRLPLHRRGMHRLIPALAQRAGAEIAELPVVHRPRMAGRSKYGIAPLRRGVAGLRALMWVRWMTVVALMAGLGIAGQAWATTPVYPPGDLAGAIELSDRLADVQVLTQGGRTWVELDDGQRMSADEFARTLRQLQAGGRGRPAWMRWLDITHPAAAVWVMVGFGGQLLFAGRMLVQWIVSERRGRSTVPPVFWVMSTGGALMLLAYFIWRTDPVGVVGQATGLLIYLRNLHLLHRHRDLAYDRQQPI